MFLNLLHYQGKSGSALIDQVIPGNEIELELATHIAQTHSIETPTQSTISPITGRGEVKWMALIDLWTSLKLMSPHGF